MSLNKRVILAKLSCGQTVRYTKIKLRPTVEDRHNNLAARRITFLLIPGNPGNDCFYAEFGEQLLLAYAQKIGVSPKMVFYAISHANHVPNGGDGKRYSLSQQIEFKWQFCCDFLRPPSKEGEVSGDKEELFLIGHSIGAFISLKLLPKLQEQGWNVAACFCLHPVVEDMALTPNGRTIGRLAQLVDAYDPIFRVFFSLFSQIVRLLPDSIFSWLCKALFGHSVADCAVKAIGELLEDPLIARNISHLTTHELQMVQQFDNSLIGEQNADRIVFFYVPSDKWTPVEFAERMRGRMAAKRGNGCSDNVIVHRESNEGGHAMDHAFVLHGSAKMAKLLVDIINARMGRHSN